MNIKKTTIIMIICLFIFNLFVFNKSVWALDAVHNTGGNHDGDGDNNERLNAQYNVEQKVKEAFLAAGITNDNVAKDVFDVYINGNIYASSADLDSILATGGEATVQIKYKNNELGKQMGDLFGKELVNVQTYMDNKGIKYTKRLRF